MELSQFLTAAAQAAGIIKEFAVAVAASVIGWYYLINAGWRLIKWSDQRRQYGAASIMVRAIVGTLFIQASTYINMVVLTVTGQAVGSENAMSVMPSGGGGDVPRMIFQTALIWLGAFGVIAILRGATLLVKASDSGSGAPSEKDPMFTAFIYIIAGAIGVNLWRFVGNLV